MNTTPLLSAILASRRRESDGRAQGVGKRQEGSRSHSIHSKHDRSQGTLEKNEAKAIEAIREVALQASVSVQS